MSTATPGRGPRGERGATGATGPASFTRGQTLAIAGFVVFAFVVLAAVTQVQASQIRENERALFAQEADAELRSCEAGVAVLRRFNAQQEALADNDRAYLAALRRQDDPDLALQDLLADRIEIYENAGQPLPNCGRLSAGQTFTSELDDAAALTAVALLQP